jgi:hypothetical protein
MRQLVKLLSIAALLCLLPSGSIAQKQARRTRKSSPRPIICKITSVPNGRVQLVDDDPIGRAFASRASDVQVEGEGTVIRVLPDDLNGSRHQRFIVQLASGQTLLITHNIDIAPRIDAVETGDCVRFYGEYVWNEKGGVIHWTHHDPRGRHVAGWLVHNGKTYK